MEHVQHFITLAIEVAYNMYLEVCECNLDREWKVNCPFWAVRIFCVKIIKYLQKGRLINEIRTYVRILNRFLVYEHPFGTLVDLHEINAHLFLHGTVLVPYRYDTIQFHRLFLMTTTTE